MSTTFENAQVGDKVWSVRYGHGVITAIYSEPDHPLIVKFERYVNPKSYTSLGNEYPNELQTLFWQEIKFEVPKQPPRMKLINGIEIPDITITPVNGDHCYIPFPTHPDLCLRIYFLYSSELDDHIINNDLCYPDTEAGKSAAILHSKAMLKR
jgi:hypothetical protein